MNFTTKDGKKISLQEIGIGMIVLTALSVFFAVVLGLGLGFGAETGKLIFFSVF